jgi:hypothetical protein
LKEVAKENNWPPEEYKREELLVEETFTGENEKAADQIAEQWGFPRWEEKQNCEERQEN